VRGFSEGKAGAHKLATNFGLAKTTNFLDTVLVAGLFYLLNISSCIIFRAKEKSI